MCTLVICRRPGEKWPLLIAANRDEKLNRPWLPPARHWPDRPDVYGGKDLLKGGTWLAINDFGVVAAVLNREGSLGPKEGLRTRGELPLEALDHADADTAIEMLADINKSSFRSFNLVIADNESAYWLKSDSLINNGRVEVFEVPSGFSMVTSADLNDLGSPRIKRFLKCFERAKLPDIESEDWNSWKMLLMESNYDPDQGAESAIFIKDNDGFGTVSSALIALPNKENQGVSPKFWFTNLRDANLD